MREICRELEVKKLIQKRKKLLKLCHKKGKESDKKGENIKLSFYRNKGEDAFWLIIQRKSAFFNRNLS
jgi:hypothetical protein